MFQESPFNGICTYATLEVILMLVGTFLLGLLLGYLIWGWLKSRIKALESDLAAANAEVNAAGLRIGSLEKDLETAEEANSELSRKVSFQTSLIERQEKQIANQNEQLVSFRTQLNQAIARASSALLALRRKSASTPRAPQRAIEESTPVHVEPAMMKPPPDEPKPIEPIETTPGLVQEIDLPPESFVVASGIFKRKVTPNDLTIIEGIGPAIADLLQRSGITTWSRLGATSSMVLRVVLDEGGVQFRMHNPKTWPRQAQMAAAGEWKKLKAYQELLKGGKEI